MLTRLDIQPYIVAHLALYFMIEEERHFKVGIFVTIGQLSLFLYSWPIYPIPPDKGASHLRARALLNGIALHAP